MPSPSWLDLFGSGLAGALLVKVLDRVYEEYRVRAAAGESARSLLAKHLDPILKSADELVGKLRSLALSDFAEFRHNPQPREQLGQLRQWAVLFLFGQFWARVQILRIESASVALGSEKTGQRLQAFLYMFESQRIRVVDRAWQRATGEALIINDPDGRRAMTFYEFLQKIKADKNFASWFDPLLSQLQRTSKVVNRQRLLVYGAVLHAMIDTLEPKHVVTRNRTGWGNKLTKKSREELEWRVFREYLEFVESPHAYTRPQK
jgi:hypothetical protein